MHNEVHAMPPPLWDEVEKGVVVFESQEFGKGAGGRLMLVGEMLTIKIRTDNHETEMSIPIMSVLLALQEQSKRVGN